MQHSQHSPFPNELVEAAAKAFHETYERLAPDYGYKTREASAVPWEDVPADNRALMLSTVAAVLPLIQQAERDRLAKQAGTNPYIDGDGIPTWAAWEAWDEGAACGVAAERERRTDDLEAAWGLIANAWNGNWNDAPVEWRDAAARFRDDRWHPLLDAALSSPAEPDTEEE